MRLSIGLGFLAALCASAPHTGHAAPPLATSALHGTTGNRVPGYLGISFRDTTDEQAAGLHQRGGRGAEIVVVDHDGPAGKAGLRPHDIVVAMNGQMLSGAEALRRMIHEAGAGTQVAIEVLRDGKPLTLNAQLADQETLVRAALAKLNAGGPPQANFSGLGKSFMPPGATTGEAGSAGTAVPVPPSRGFIGSVLHGGFSTGLTLQAMEPQLADFFGAPAGMGLLVQSVEPASPAALAGLHAGDVILRADLYALHSASDLSKRLHAAKGRPVILSILRDRHEETLSLQSELKHHSRLDWPF